VSSTRTRTTNVLIIGAGGGGLRGAIAATQAGADVLIVGKRARNDAHTTLAAGGVNAVLGTRDPEDSVEQHFADTYRDGYEPVSYTISEPTRRVVIAFAVFCL
jgi:succinate dehydrogenase / fumarate reductase flavoprotein subunit